MSQTQFFTALDWYPDRMVWNDLIFRLEHHKNDDTWELGDECFVFYKIP